MKILVMEELDDQQLCQIQTISDQIEVVFMGTQKETLEVMPDVEAIFGSMNREMFKRAEKLRWVQTWGAGVDGMLFSEFVESGIMLTSAKGIVGIHLAEQAIALLLGITRGIAWAVRKPDWNQRMPIRKASWELSDRTMGIVGLGGTGKALAIRAHAFGMHILAVDPEDVEAPECVNACWKMDRFFDLLEVSDVVAVCAPLTLETEGMFNKDAFRCMQNHALLINVTRGKIVDEKSLMEALKQGQIGGVGLDVTPQEPLPENHPLWKMENALISPHVAGGSPNRQDRIVELFCKNLKRFLKGEPLLSLIDKKKGY